MKASFGSGLPNVDNQQVVELNQWPTNTSSNLSEVSNIVRKHHVVYQKCQKDDLNAPHGCVLEEEIPVTLAILAYLPSCYA